MMLEVMREVKNFFQVSYEEGRYKIENSEINFTEKYSVGSYILITGSMMNNGVYRIFDSIYTLEGAVNEEFDGVIYRLAVPRDFIALVDKIEKFEEDNSPSNISGERFGAYSYTLAVTKDGSPLSWRDIFRRELLPYRTKMFAYIKI